MLSERQFRAGAVELNYAEGPANGPPLVILHGGSGNWQSGGSLIDALLDRWHICAPDFRGHGASGRVPTPVHPHVPGDDARVPTPGR